MFTWKVLPIIPSLNFDYLKEENTNLSTLQIQPSTFHLCWTITIWSICTFPCSKNAGYDVVVWNNEIYGTQRPHELVLVQVTLFLCFLLVLYFFSVHRLRPYFLLLLQNLLKFRYVNHFISCISLIVFLVIIMIGWMISHRLCTAGSALCCSCYFGLHWIDCHMYFHKVANNGSVRPLPS